MTPDPVSALRHRKRRHIDVCLTEAVEYQTVTTGLERYRLPYNALTQTDLDAVDLLIIENVGNLVCPAEFDIGEDARVVVLSVTEGEDKPVKYPTMFRLCDAALLNKIDLLPYLDYDKAQAVGYIHQVHPGMPVFEISARSGEGMEGWIGWLKEKVSSKLRARS